MILIISGVSGVGKSTIGQRLAARLGCDFLEGDDYHPAANRAKMAAGLPLDDTDRLPWLQRLQALIHDYLQQDRCAVLACSALKTEYRAKLRLDPARVRFVFLQGDYTRIAHRVAQRQGHFMPPQLLESQFDSLQPPRHAIQVSVDQPPEAIVEAILRQLASAEPPQSSNDSSS